MNQSTKSTKVVLDSMGPLIEPEEVEGESGVGADVEEMTEHAREVQVVELGVEETDVKTASFEKGFDPSIEDVPGKPWAGEGVHARRGIKRRASGVGGAPEKTMDGVESPGFAAQAARGRHGNRARCRRSSYFYRLPPGIYLHFNPYNFYKFFFASLLQIPCKN